nr:MAG: capsid protein [Crogonang virus 142]
MVFTRYMNRMRQAATARGSANVAKAVAGQVVTSVAKSLYQKGINKAANKIVKTVTGKKRKRKTTERKTRNKIRKIVKQELKKDVPQGRYVKMYGGFAKLPAADHENNTVDATIFLQNVPGALNKQFNALKRLDFFTPVLLNDVASVLFNGKNALVGPDTTGDFAKIADLKFTIYDARATVMFKNCTEMTLELVVYEITPRDLEEEDFGTDWVKAMESTNMTQVGGTTATPFTLGVSPLQLKGLWERYKMVQKKKSLRPGQSFSHQVKMPKNFEFDGSKYFDSNVLAKYTKFSKQIWYSYNSLPQSCYDSANDRLRMGRPILIKDANVHEPSALVIDVKEQYKISCPDNAPIEKQVDTYCWLPKYDVFEQTITKISEYAPSYSLASEAHVSNTV